MKLRVSYTNNGNIDKSLLLDLFEEYGSVNNLKVFKGLNSALGMTFAIVDMQGEYSAIKALKELNGSEFENSYLQVEVSNDLIKGKDKPFRFSKEEPKLESDDDDDLGVDDEEEEVREAPEPYYMPDEGDEF